MDYYAAKADVRMFEDQMAEIDADHEEERVLREIHAEQSVTDSLTDVEFENEYTTRRGEVILSLERAQARLEDVVARCISEGIDMPAKPPDITAKSLAHLSKHFSRPAQQGESSDAASLFSGRDSASAVHDRKISKWLYEQPNVSNMELLGDIDHTEDGGSSHG